MEELLARMSSRELTDWMGLVKIENWEREKERKKAEQQSKSRRGRRR